MKVKNCLLWLLTAALAGGCAAPALSPTPVPVASLPVGQLTPFQPSPSPTASPTPAPLATPQPAPSPTPTPLIHIVQAKEDMYAIAFRYHVSVEALIAANPNINPRAMSIGAALVIPASAQSSPAGPAQTTTVAAPTPMPVRLPEQPDCWPAGGGMWCFLLAQNPLDAPAENILTRFRLSGEDGAVAHEREVSGLLNLLPPSGQMPLAVYFPGPVPAAPRAAVELITAYPLPAGDTRYLAASLSAVSISIQPDGGSAELSGQIAAREADAQTAWVAAAALDASGRVVGVRRWENPRPLSKDQPVPFRLTVYSLGGAITRLEYLAEIRR